MAAKAQTLHGSVALVAGASRGCGRGLAIALGDAGATVYVTGRTVRDGARPADGAPGTVEDTADEVTRRGGRGIPLRLDHTDAVQVTDLFSRIEREEARVDVMACAVWGGNERYLDAVGKQPFWEQPVHLWREYVDAGAQAFWMAAHGAARLMSRRASGLIVAISEPILEGAFEGQSPATTEMFSEIGHAAINRLVRGLANDARTAGVAVVGLLPGFMKTERVEMHLESMGASAREQFRYDLAESTEYAGRAVAALAADPNVLAKTGRLHYVADLAEEYGFTDVDGTRVGNFYRALGLIP